MSLKNFEQTLDGLLTRELQEKDESSVEGYHRPDGTFVSREEHEEMNRRIAENLTGDADANWQEVNKAAQEANIQGNKRFIEELRENQEE